MPKRKPGPNHVVLSIDDNDLARSLIARIVSLRDNTELLLAATAKEGLELAVERKPDLILLDAGLPDGDPTSVVKALRERAETGRIPIAIVSGWREQSLGLDDPSITYLHKPFDVDDLLALLERVLGPD